MRVGATQKVERIFTCRCSSFRSPPEFVAGFMNHLRPSLHTVVRLSASRRHILLHKPLTISAISSQALRSSSWFCQKSSPNLPFTFASAAAAESQNCKRCISRSASLDSLPANWGQNKTHRKVKVNVNWGTMTADQEIKLAPLRQSVKEQVS